MKELRLIRKSAGFGIQQAAVLVGISPSYLSLIERGKRETTLPMIKRIFNAYGYELNIVLVKK